MNIAMVKVLFYLTFAVWFAYDIAAYWDNLSIPFKVLCIGGLVGDSIMAALSILQLV